MVLNVCVKSGVQQKFGSPDMGPLVTPERLFRPFLEKYQTYFKDFLPEGGHYGTKAWFEIWDPAEFRFSGYGALAPPQKGSEIEVWPFGFIFGR